MNTSVTNQKTRRKLHRNVIERIKESKWGIFVNQTTLMMKHRSTGSLYLLNIFTRLINRPLFPVLKVQIMKKVKMTCHKVIGDGCIWEDISLMDA